MQGICGIDMDILYDKYLKPEILSVELMEENGCPLIVLFKKNKQLLRLHLKEAIELKSNIDELVVDWFEHLIQDKSDGDIKVQG